MKSIVYIGSVIFPSNSAATRRILGNIKCFQLLGYKTTVISAKEQTNIDYENYENIEIIQINERKREKSTRFIKHLSYFNIGKRSIDWLEVNKNDIKAVVLYSGYTPYLLKLISWSKKNNIPIIFDAVEWYDPPNKWSLYFDPYFWNIEIAMRFLIKKTRNVIAISSFLERYYRARDCNTMIIPPLLDVLNIQPNLSLNNEKLVLSYTGNPGKKDLFNNYLEAIYRVDPEGLNIIFHIAGLSNEELLKFDFFKRNNIEILPHFIKNEGKVSFQQAIEINKNADFSLLQRPYARSTEAGFPTKLVESLSMGTPVILNFTSDIKNYLDLNSCIECKNSSVDSLEEAILQALSLNSHQKRELRINSRKTAESFFDYRVYKTKFSNFLQNIKQIEK